jgi:hypothetical protein
VTYLHCNRAGSSVHVRCGEAEQAKPGADEAVLAAVVINQPVTVVAAVVLDCQALLAIKQVWSAHEMAPIVADGNLNLRPWQPSKKEDHPQPGLHRGLSLRLGQFNSTAKSSDALGSRMVRDISAQLGDGKQPGMKEEVYSDYPFSQWISASEVNHRTEC